MLRDPSLIPLSRQHHDGLALCVYIRRAYEQGREEAAHWQAEMVRAWEGRTLAGGDGPCLGRRDPAAL
jgi:hypothetical protein